MSFIITDCDLTLAQQGAPGEGGFVRRHVWTKSELFNLEKSYGQEKRIKQDESWMQNLLLMRDIISKRLSVWIKKHMLRNVLGIDSNSTLRLQKCPVWHKRVWRFFNFLWLSFTSWGYVKFTEHSSVWCLATQFYSTFNQEGSDWKNSFFLQWTHIQL